MPPMGDHAWERMPRSVFAASTADWRKYGWTSTWFTAGVTDAVSARRARYSGMKLLTPIARTTPFSSSVSSAR